MHELRLALRRLRRRPGRGTATALTLAIGIGATTAAFAAVDIVLLRALPVDRQDELVVAWLLNPERGSLEIPFLSADYGVVRRGARSLTSVAAFTAWGALPAPVDGVGEAYSVEHTRVAGDFFGVLGARPAVGRLLEESDDHAGASPVAVLSHAAWETRYGADPNIIGASLTMADDGPVTVVGVAPEGFDLPRGTELWMPLRGDYASSAGALASFELHIVGRMARGFRPETVAADIAATLTSAGDVERRLFWAGSEPVVVELEEHVVGAVRPVIRAGAIAALVLLLAAGANATLLLLARGPSAAHDLAVRRALGAARARLVWRLTADSAVLCALGTAGGLGLAWLALEVLVPLAPPELQRVQLVGLHGSAIAFALLVGLASSAVIGAAAALFLSGLDLRALVAGGGRRHTGRGADLRRAVAGFQVALTVVTGVGAGLLIRTVAAMNRLDPGLSAGDMASVSLRVPYGWLSVPESYLAALEEVVRDLESRPGILAVRPTLGPPLQQRLEVALAAEGQTDEEVALNPYVAVDAVLPGHLQAMGIPLLAGRGLTELDNRPDAEPVVIVDEVLARSLWPGESPLGKRLTGFATDSLFTVVGLAGATRYREFWEPHPRAYYPLRRLGNSPPSALLVRTSDVTALPLQELVRDAFGRVDPGVRVMSVEPMADVLRQPTMGRRFAAGVLVFLGAATLLLAALGIHGVFTVSVQERTREMGVRRALGAQRAGIAGLVLMGILRVAAVGAIGGALAALWATRFVASLLYGVPPTDLATVAAVLLGSLVLAVASGLAPALRASSTDPALCLSVD